LFDDPYRYMDESRPAREVLSDAHRAAAREFAARSFVLLKNDGQVLPLKKSGSIALVGPLADSRRNMLGTWSVSGDFNKAVTVTEGMRSVGGNGVTINYAKGANITDDTILAQRVNVFGEQVTIDPRSPQAMIDEAVAAAQRSDVTVAVVGESAEMSGESSSRSDIGLPESQLRLLQALKATGKPLVIVLFNGRPMTLNWEAANANALLDVWFGGTEGGNAIADVLFGHYNPSGKLTTSFPRNVGQIPVYYNHLSTGRPYVSGAPKFRSVYLDVPNDPLFPFGYGLSYTTFSYSPVQLGKQSVRPGETLQAAVTVTNTGNFDGEETVQLYLQDVYASIAQPVKQLKHFQKVQLRKGESKTVTFTISYDDLKFYNNDLKLVAEQGDFNVFIGGNSRDVQKASFRLTER
jgi:beta-glucosidase